MSSILNGVGAIVSAFQGRTGAETKESSDYSNAIEQVFSRLDNDGSGYLDASDFQAVFSRLGLGASEGVDGNLTSAGAAKVVSVLDGDGDGKVTTEDMTQGLQALTERLGVARVGEEDAAITQSADKVDPLASDAAASLADEVSAEQLVMRRILALMDVYGVSSRSGDTNDLLSEIA